MLSMYKGIECRWKLDDNFRGINSSFRKKLKYLYWLFILFFMSFFVLNFYCVMTIKLLIFLIIITNFIVLFFNSDFYFCL